MKGKSILVTTIQNINTDIWVTIDTSGSTVSHWVYIHMYGSTASDWIYITNNHSSADYVVCVSGRVNQNGKMVAAAAGFLGLKLINDKYN